MKKNRILAIFAAAALAAVSVFTPIADNIGLSVPASAVTSDGLWLSAPTDNPDPADKGNAANTKYINSLQPGDEVQLNITIPDLASDLNSVQLKIKYNYAVDENTLEESNVDLVECTRWYQTGWERAKNEYIVNGQKRTLYTNDELSMIERWPAAGDYIGNGVGHTGEANFKKTEFTDAAYLTLTSPTGDNAITAFNGQSVTLFARFKIKSVNSVSDLNFKIVEHLFDDGTDTDIWDPAANQITAKGTIAAAITGKIVPYNFDNNPAIEISIDAPGVVNWCTIPNAPGVDPVITTDGTFEFKGLKPECKYTLKINDVWCKNDSFEVAATKFTTMTYDIGNWAIWLYGDVDNDGIIGASDATQILRCVVGKNSVLYGKVAGDDVFDIADVNEDGIVNVRDATQILKKAAGLASVFDGKP